LIYPLMKGVINSSIHILTRKMGKREMTDHIEIKAALSVGEAGKLTGIAWPFGEPDRVGDIIEKGAFANVELPLPMLAFHNQAETVGLWERVEEKADGLHIEGRLLLDDVARAREIHALIKNKAISGLSIGFCVEKAKARAGGGRIISNLQLVEISVVAVPAHPGAQITSAKTLDDRKVNIMEENKENTTPNLAALETKIDGVADNMKALTGRVDKLEARDNRPNTGEGTPQEKGLEVKAFGTYLRQGKEALGEEERKALTLGNAAQAGYLAPPEFGDEIIKLLRELSPIRQYANVKAMSGAEIIWPRRKASTQAVWVGETDDRTASEPQYEQVTIKPHEMATYTDISRQLLEDNAYNLEAELQSDLAESFAITEGSAFVTGTGTGQPMGLLTSTQIQTVTAATLTADTVIDLFYSLPSFHAQNGTFVMNRNTLAAVRKLKDSNGAYIWQESIRDGQPATLLGRPVVEAVDMPDPAKNNTPIIFGDLSGYRIMDRIGFEILVDPYTLATKGMTRFHARRRVGADVTNPDRLKKLKLTA